MQKPINYFAGTLTALVMFCGESLSTGKLLALSILTSSLIWFGMELGDELKDHSKNYLDVPGAPIASAVARDLNVQVPNV